MPTGDFEVPAVGSKTLWDLSREQLTTSASNYLTTVSGPTADATYNAFLSNNNIRPTQQQLTFWPQKPKEHPLVYSIDISGVRPLLADLLLFGESVKQQIVWLTDKTDDESKLELKKLEETLDRIQRLEGQFARMILLSTPDTSPDVPF